MQLPQLGAQVPRRGNALTQWLGVTLLRVLGWRVEGQFPDVPQAVVIAAPHTSNWDGAITLGTVLALRLNIHWMGKSSMFRFPFRRLLLWMGGIPVDRSAAKGMVQASAEVFALQPQFLMLVAPEGTRSASTQWKTGFYQIANLAGVPIVLGYIDFQRKRIGFGPLALTTGNMEQDIRTIRSFYDDKVARHATRFEKSGP